ncbi:hypothetical protein MiHa_04411 [Microcystis aeruginosa NIES-2522]|nr:hypothetical protein MiHa_04411 [Microcystis aeruginosa NIES-2522]
MKGQEKLVQETLSQPDEIRRSRSDPNVYLFYQLQRPKRWGSSRFCVISLIDIGSIDLCVLCVFVVRSTPSLLRNVS